MRLSISTLGDRRVVVPISNTISVDGYRDILAKSDGALAVKMHAATFAFLALQGVHPIEEAHDHGLLFFMDEKFDEIPSEVEACARRWQGLGVDMLTGSTSGTRPMLEALRAGASTTTTFGVTILTTMVSAACKEAFQNGNIPELVCLRARMAQKADMDGTVSAPGDLISMKKDGILLNSHIRLVPNIRFDDMPGIPGDDQNQDRKMDPYEVGYLCGDSALMVIGRPIYGAEDPAAALELAQTRFEAGRKAAA